MNPCETEKHRVDSVKQQDASVRSSHVLWIGKHRDLFTGNYRGGLTVGGPPFSSPDPPTKPPSLSASHRQKHVDQSSVPPGEPAWEQSKHHVARIHRATKTHPDSKQSATQSGSVVRWRHDRLERKEMTSRVFRGHQGSSGVVRVRLESFEDGMSYVLPQRTSGS